MKIFEYFIILLSFIIITFGINYMFGYYLNFFISVIFGLLISYIISMILLNKNIKFLKKYKYNLNVFALITSLIGGSLWTIGEFLVYKGHSSHELLNPIGAFSTTIGALMALILYMNK